LLALYLALHSAQSIAQGGCEYSSTANPHSDGIPKSFCGRQIARVMGWQGADWLDRPERIKEERTDLLIARLRLKPGQVVGDIGAGTGTLTRQMAKAVLPGGRVWAVDIQIQMLSFLKQMASAFKPGDIEIRQSEAQHVNIPDNTLDVAVMVDVYHELEYPKETLESLIKAVKPGGQVIFVEYRANDFRVPIKPIHTMTIAQVRKEAQAAGLVYERTEEPLPWQDVIVFRRP
jgi:ubiquinone/menaquinone biosynthesis C-methylase UbiE